MTCMFFSSSVFIRLFTICFSSSLTFGMSKSKVICGVCALPPRFIMQLTRTLFWLKVFRALRSFSETDGTV